MWTDSIFSIKERRNDIRTKDLKFSLRVFPLSLFDYGLAYTDYDFNPEKQLVSLKIRFNSELTNLIPNAFLHEINEGCILDTIRQINFESFKNKHATNITHFLTSLSLNQYNISTLRCIDSYLENPITHYLISDKVAKI